VRRDRLHGGQHGRPTYVFEGTASAPDLTLTSGPLLVNHWRTTHTIGRCGHKVIQYDLSIDDQHSQWPSQPRARPKTTSISWQKVKWEDFNATVEKLYFHHPVHSTTPSLSVHAQTRALTTAFQLASKRLPRGCRPDPASWMTPEVHDALERRDYLRLAAETSQLTEDWDAWKLCAQETQTLINSTKRLQWREFCTSLNHRSDPGKVMKVLKAINAHPTTPSTYILMDNNKTCNPDVDKARSFLIFA